MQGPCAKTPSPPPRVLRALELFGPQARPYNFDDCFDCWGLVRRVFDHLDDGFEMDEELRGPGDPEERNWVAFAGAGELVPGDLLVTHPHFSEDFHAAFFCGVAGGRDLVYDASPRGPVPLFAATGDGWKLADARDIHTRYARATETTDRLRNDGGAYLRLWDERQVYYHRGAARASARGRRERGRRGRARPCRAAPGRRPLRAAVLLPPQPAARRRGP